MAAQSSAARPIPTQSALPRSAALSTLVLPQHRFSRQHLLTRSLAIAAVATGQRASVRHIPGDGSCMFRALAQGHHILNKGQPLDAQGLTVAGDQLRADICEEMHKRRAELEPFVGPIEPYIRRMKRQGEWGGEPELAVAPHCLRRPVHVFQPQWGRLQNISQYGADEYSKQDPVSLLYNGHNHYDLLVKQN